MPSTPVTTERRKKLRKKPLRLVYVELALGNGGMMRDLSEEGFAVRAMMPFKKGDQTTFAFTLGDATRIEGEGKILWIDEGGRVAGIHFTQLSPQMRSQIDDWLIEEEHIPSPREAVKEPAVDPASTLEKLREEIRSTPARSEVPAALPQKDTPAEHPRAEVPAEVHSEPPAIAEPRVHDQDEGAAHRKAEIVAAPKVQIAAKEPVKIESPPAEPTRAALEMEIASPVPPKVSRDPVAPATSSVTEGFFRKWPKNKPTVTDTAEAVAPELPVLPLPISAAGSAKQKSFQIEDVQTAERDETKPSLPDISDILMQPHGLSPRDQVAALPSAETFGPDETPRASGEWFTLQRAILTMVVLMIIVGAIVFHRAVGSGLIWLGEAIGGTSNTGAITPANSDKDANAGSSNSVADEAKPAKPAANVAGLSVIPPAGAEHTNPSGSASSNTGAPVTPFSSPEASSDSGQPEYQQAVQLMRSRNGGADMPQVVRLLWIAVEKGNLAAELTLADLYWRGHGVVHNCDQARILLMAAVRKGSNDAQKRLQEFQKEGCE